MRKLTLMFLVFIFVLLDTLSQGDYTVAIDDRIATMELTNEAMIHIEEREANIALDKLLKAIVIDSTYRQTYLQIFQAGILNIENSDRVINGLNKGKRIFQEDDELYFYCGEIYRLNSDYDNAMLEYTAAVKYAKKNGEDFYLVPCYYFNRGNCYLKKKYLEAALEDYNYSLKLKPDFLNVLANRGVCLFQLGNKEEACQDWKKAKEKGNIPSKHHFDKHCTKE